MITTINEWSLFNRKNKTPEALVFNPDDVTFAVSEDDTSIETPEGDREAKAFTLTITYNNAKIGQITFYEDYEYDFLMVDDALIQSEYQRKGVYTRALNYMLDYATDHGYEGLASMDNNRNELSSAFWNKIPNKKEYHDEPGVYYLISHIYTGSYK